MYVSVCWGCCCFQIQRSSWMAYRGPIVSILWIELFTMSRKKYWKIVWLQGWRWCDQKSQEYPRQEVRHEMRWFFWVYNYLWAVPLALISIHLCCYSEVPSYCCFKFHYHYLRLITTLVVIALYGWHFLTTESKIIAIYSIK